MEYVAKVLKMVYKDHIHPFAVQRPLTDAESTSWAQKIVDLEAAMVTNLNNVSSPPTWFKRPEPVTLPQLRCTCGGAGQFLRIRFLCSLFTHPPSVTLQPPRDAGWLSVVSAGSCA